MLTADFPFISLFLAYSAGSNTARAFLWRVWDKMRAMLLGAALNLLWTAGILTRGRLSQVHHHLQQ